MQLAIEDSSLEQVVDLIMKKRGYVPENQIVGRTCQRRRWYLVF